MRDVDFFKKELDEIFGRKSDYDWRIKNHWDRWNDYFCGGTVKKNKMHPLLWKIVGDLKQNNLPVNLINFVNHPRLADQAQNKESYYGILTLYFYAMMLCQDGWVYRVDPKLAYLLARTNLKNVKTDLVRLPYPAVFIDIPKEAGLRVYNWETGWHDVECAYIIEEENTEAYKRVLRVCVAGKSKTDNPFDDASIVYFISMDNENIEDSIEDSKEKLAIKCKPVEREYQRQSLPVLFRFLMNIILYMTSVEADIIKRFNPEYQRLRDRMIKTKNKQKRRRLSKELSQTDSGKVRILGSKLVLEGKIPFDDSQSKNGGAGGKGKKLSVRSWVSGHWQGYWIGPKDDKKKVGKWKKPYLRGPEMAEVVKKQTIEVRQPRAQEGES